MLTVYVHWEDGLIEQMEYPFGVKIAFGLPK